VSATVPAGPLESAPGGFLPGEERSSILAGVLEGVEMGSWDRRVVGWLSGLDTSTALTIASLIARARETRPARWA
jgi:hypothetical protein